MDRDIIMRKLDSLTRCVGRIEEKRPDTPRQLIDDIDIQDILSINLERAVQVSVDIGTHLIADLSVPPPKTMGKVFAILVAEKNDSGGYGHRPAQSRWLPQSFRPCLRSGGLGKGL